MLTRYAGLGSDNLVAIEAVDGTGKVIIANASQHGDLLWASRGGGGGNFAVVTAFVFRTVDVSSGVTVFKYAMPRDKVGGMLQGGRALH